ncbi:MAG TPA: chromosomal replication initiator protein DnaA [Acidimicrobiales bacterium]|nr:chromosomal replication initiator protein DnaA [Acidimicrobiales bacterium]
MSEAAELWTTCTEVLREEVREAVWRTWFDGLQPLSLDSDSLVLTAPSGVVRDRLEERYLSLIEQTASQLAETDLRVRIVVRPAPQARDHFVSVSDPVDSQRAGGGPGGPVDGADPALTRPDPVAERAPSAIPAPPRAEPPSLNPRYTFDAFVIGSSNRFAHAAAQRVAESPAGSYNPLFIYGDSGLGKTHLLHAIGHYVTENFAGKRVRYVSTETFMNDFVDAIRNSAQMAFKRRYRECDVLLVDDIQFMEGKEGLQEEFFHTFNWLYEGSKQIVLSSDRHPRSIATLEDRLRSRFEWGLTTDVQPPELETRLAILRKKAEGERMPIPNDVLELIATHVRDNIRELEGALIRVSAYASLNREPPTLATAAEILSDLLEADRPRQITPKVILDATAETFGFSVEDLCGTSRRRPLVQARQIGMYVFRELTDFSYPAIAREFGGRDHTTVIHAVEKVAGLMKERRQVYDQVTELIQSIKGGR